MVRRIPFPGSILSVDSWDFNTCSSRPTPTDRVLFLPSLNKRLRVAVKISLLRNFKNDAATETGVNSARDETAPLSRSINVAR
jgi:hypothetical protein